MNSRLPGGFALNQKSARYRLSNQERCIGGAPSICHLRDANIPNGIHPFCDHISSKTATHDAQRPLHPSLSKNSASLTGTIPDKDVEDLLALGDVLLWAYVPL